jgi:C4-dicarboxylate-specific signal transduction histidine kinase
MTTRSKAAQNKPLPTHDRLPEPSVDLFIVHDERGESANRVPTSNTLSDIAGEPPRETEHTLQKILFENRIAELASHVAHELNNPLATILVYVQLLQTRGNIDGITREGLRTIYREAECASAITADLLCFARRGKPEKQLISIQEVIQRSLELHIHRLMENNIEVAVRLQPDIPKTMADPYQIQQAFTNIIANAEQSMIEAHGRGKLYIKSGAVGELIRITFDDDGPGIPQHNLKSIFDPFFTTRRTGLGLGLTICCAILESHGGSIYATNKPERGAAFVVELPISNC